MKKLYYLLALLFILVIPLSSKAQVSRTGDFIYIAKDEIVEGNFYFSGKSILVEGQIIGDLIGFAPNIKINGEVKGDVLVLSQNLNIDGIVSGNLRSASNVVNINGEIGKNVNLLSESLFLGENSIIGADVLLKSFSSEFNGKIAGNLYGSSNKTIIRGEIEKDTNLIIDYYQKKKTNSFLEITETSKIGGSLTYKGVNEADIKTENITGKITKNESPKKNKGNKNAGKFTYTLLSSFLIAIILNKLCKKRLNRLKEIIISKNYKLGLPGLAILFLSPIVAIFLILTIVAIPISLIILVTWIILVYLSKIIFSLSIGDYIFKLAKKENTNIYLKNLAGIFFCLSLFSLPFIGWLFSFTAVLAGIGSVYYLIKK